MTVTVIFKKMPGPRQVQSITYRIETDETDILSAVAEAIEQAVKVTSVKIAEVRVKL